MKREKKRERTYLHCNFWLFGNVLCGKIPIGIRWMRSFFIPLEMMKMSLSGFLAVAFPHCAPKMKRTHTERETHREKEWERPRMLMWIKIY